MTLDLSHNIKIKDMKHQSVNKASEAIAPQESMAKLGSFIPCFVEAVANAPIQEGPICFAKFDIKDKHWHMVV